jgi:UDP-N-acetylglucosamine diphosphorylase/glucosamine-1-phosphate N-acetyltransferase
MKLPNLVFFDNLSWQKLLPLTFTKPASELRVGITTIREKWMQYAMSVSWKTQDYLSEKYKLVLSDDNYFVSAQLIPTPELVAAIANLTTGQALFKNSQLLAFRSGSYNIDDFDNQLEYAHTVIAIENTWDIFEKNDEILRLDFNRLTKNRTSASLSKSNNVVGAEDIFVEPGAKVEFATLDASGGPIYIGKDAEIMAGSLIQGPLALCEHATIKMGAKIYGATTIGPWSKAAGEIQNSVITGYSNKGHDGYLGNAVLGEWCNVGADSNNSNLKNNYAKVKLWSYEAERFVNTGLQFCGLIMGDHSKCGINTMFNTGTVIGVSANIFGSGFPRNFIPSFSWGGAGGFSLYTLNKAIETAEIVMARRKIQLSTEDKSILKQVFHLTEKYRK